MRALLLLPVRWRLRCLFVLRLTQDRMSKIREPYQHDEYAAYLGECRCKWCRPIERDPEEIWDERREERDDALEWGGVDKL